MRLHKHPFNMVEIVLALVVIVVGIIGIMALLPASQLTAQKGYSKDHSQIAAEQYLRLISGQVKRRWAVAATIPMSKPPPEAENPDQVNWSSADSNQIITQVEGLTLYYNDMDNDGKLDYQVDADNLTRDDSGLYKLVQRSGGNVEDFSAIIRVWKSSATYKSYSTTAGSFSGLKPVPPDAGLTLNVEVSYPASIPYARRERSLHMLDVFRPDESEPATVEGAFQITQSGKLKFTYHGSEAGLESGFFMLIEDQEVEDATEIFASNKKTEQATTYDMEFESGTDFNFFSRTYASSWGMSTYDHFAWAEEVEPVDHYAASGEINLNPNNRPDYEFTLNLPDGGTITRDDLHKGTIVSEAGVAYHGPATRVFFRPKGNGNQNGMVIEGEIYPFQNSRFYEIVTDVENGMNLTVFNDKVKNGKCMGHWWLRIESTHAALFDNGSVVEVHPGRAQGEIPYFDDPPTDRSGAFDYLSGNPYCMVIELIPGYKWLLGFEDLPGDRDGDGKQDWIDWDYNDVVVTVELIPSDGVAAAATAATVGGTVELNPNGGTWRMTLTKPDGSLIDGTNLPSGGYNGLAMAVWFRPTGDGQQSLTVDGDSVYFQNEKMVSVCADNMNVNLRKVSGRWTMTIDNCDDAYLVIMD